VEKMRRYIRYIKLREGDGEEVAKVRAKVQALREMI
jgi:hypothetical protein